MIFVLFVLFSMMFSSCGSSRNVVKDDIYENPKTETSSKDKDKKKPKKVQKEIIKCAKSWIGTPYLYGGNTKKGVDCSGLTCQIFREVADIKLPRSSRQQANHCKKIKKKELKPGDLVFFTAGSKRINHVALYIGDNQIIHSTSSRGVVISNLNDKYWSKHFHHCGRVEELFPQHAIFLKNQKMSFHVLIFVNHFSISDFSPNFVAKRD